MRPDKVDTSIFSRVHTAAEAKRARKLENIYHAGQHKIWDGRDVMSDLLGRHGGIQLDRPRKMALARVMSGLMWGELVAWRVAAQLADRLECFEAKIAATSQAHDEARHFYVMHDYLQALEVPIPDLDISTRHLLEMVLRTDRVAEKLVGMQLFVETMALTLFKILRELQIEPVLTELMPFYERDEARHVGLGVQHCPVLAQDLSRADQARLVAFQGRMFITALVSLKRTAPALDALGIDPRAVAEAGRAMFDRITADLIRENGGTAVRAVAGPIVIRGFDATKEVMFPRDPRISARLWEAGRAFVNAA
jgi:hypothetical protein